MIDQKSVLLQSMFFASTLEKYLMSHFKGVDLSYDEAKLVVEIKQYEPLSQKELASLLHITPATLSTRLKRLEKLGFIQRSSNPIDTRKTDVSLTELGNRQMECGKAKFKEMVEEADSFFTPEQKQQYLELLEIIQQKMKGEQDD